MEKINIWAFTLVELIVVITIVWILSTVWFVSYSGYLAWARDSNRINQMVKLSDSLQVYSATKTLPLPDNYVEIQASGSTIAYQGELGVDVLETIDYTNWWVDPKDGNYYTYYLTKDRRSLQLMALMEEQQSTTQITTNTYAASYDDRYPKVYGRKLWVLVSAEEPTMNTPIHQLSPYKEGAAFDVVNEVGIFISHISDSEKFTWSGEMLQNMIPNASCKRLRQVGGFDKNQFYDLYIDGEVIKAFCHQDFIEQIFYTFIDNGWFEKTRINPWYENYLSSSSAHIWSQGVRLGWQQYNITWDNYIYVDPKKNYVLSWYFRSQWVWESKLHYGFQEYDEDFNPIIATNVNIVLDTETTLTSSVWVADTSIIFENIWGTMCDIWEDEPLFLTHGIIAFDIDDSWRYSDLPNYNVSPSYNSWGAIIGFSSIINNGSTCTLYNSWNPIGQSYPVGTKIRMHNRGGTYNYVTASNDLVPNSWTEYSWVVNGQQQYGIDNSQFRPGTRFIKLYIIANNKQDSSKILELDDLSLEIQ